MSLLTAREVSKRYGPVVALRSATLVVEPGEVHALLGANGAGKSTLVKVLTGVIRQDTGTIQVNGDDTFATSPNVCERDAPAAERIEGSTDRTPASRSRSELVSSDLPVMTRHNC